jgi:hypothetical protein
MKALPASPSAAPALGRAPYVLSLALAGDAAVASLASLLFRSLLRGEESGIGSLQGTALIVLIVGLPVLVGSMLLTYRGSTYGPVGWLGALGFVFYQAVLFLFMTPFNGLFFMYVAMLSLSVWSIVALVARYPVEELAQHASPRMPVRALAAYLIANAALFGALWLRATVPAIFEPWPPAFLDGTGLLTGAVQILDLAFTLPLMAVGAIWLWQRRPWGYLLGGALLVMLVIETTSIGTDQWFGAAADPTSPAVSATLTPVFAVLTLFGLIALAFYLRHLRQGVPGPGRMLQASVRDAGRQGRQEATWPGPGR